MYDFVSGALISCEGELAVVETGGIGYRIAVPSTTARTIADQQHVRLFTVLRIRDEQMQLYGFATTEEREVFERVCTISGIGPSTGLAILSGIPPEEFRHAVLDGQVGVLQRIKGIGRKTAERLILELKEVFGREPVSSLRLPANRLEEDALGALVALGVPASQAHDAVRKAVSELASDASLEEVIKVASRRA